ncbi:P27 family phage terminase small subunit [Eubacterium limosum]|uniref:P27 family phage terminase small subunit n=1 Tax=Eubacterium limosum TaxID=1736 RepID=A0ABT5UT42_EUBLI|nr:P27 family phage terminase small subunit [Eubacterium limosum]MDE1472141.1 P27 family phage terminase small subunit [Eubacterium limosum]
MAKDGTARGGARVGSGRKSKAVTDRINEGETANVTVLKVPEDVDLKGNDMPEPKSYMKARQKNEKGFVAEEIYKETWIWLKARGCERLVSQQLIEQYAMSVSRWIQCEECISEYGFLAKHPTTGNAIASPYVAMSQQYMKQVNQLWFQIYQIVKENCTVEYQGGTPQDDVMERLLRTRRS